MNDNIKELKVQIEKLKREVRELLSKKDALNNRLNALSNDSVAYIENIEKLKKSYSKEQGFLIELRERQKKINSEIKSSKEELANLNSQSAELTKINKKLHDEYRDEINGLSEKKVALGKLEAEIERNVAEAKQVRASVENKFFDLTVIDAEEKLKLKKLNGLIEENAEAKERLACLIAKSEKDLKEKANELDHLLSEAKDKEHEAGYKLKVAKDLAEQHKQELEKSKVESARLKEISDKLELEQKSLDQGKEALRSKEKEIAIKELRFKKLVHEKDLQKEFEELNASLK